MPNEAENPSEIETVISDAMEVAETFNNFLVNIVPSLVQRKLWWWANFKLYYQI